MACNEWNDHLLEKLYGEIDRDRLDNLQRHLQECPACVSELAAMEHTRQDLAGAMPAVPEPPRVLLIADGGTRGHLEGWWRSAGGWRMFAAGFAAAAVLLAAGLATGLALAPRGGTPLPVEPREAAETQLVDRSQLDQLLDARDARILNLMDQQSGQVQDSLTAFSSAVEARRKEDLRLVLGELITTEMWTGKAITENRESLRHLTLAGQPGVTQW